MGKKRVQARPAEKRAQLALKASWEKKRDNENLNQAEAAEACGWSPANFSHYINGRNPLNYPSLAILCDYLRESPMDIWPEMIRFKSKIGAMEAAEKARGETSGSLSATALHIAKRADTLGSSRKIALKKFVDQYVDGYVAIDIVKTARRKAKKPEIA